MSPDASVQDGFVDVCVITAFPVWRLVEMGIRMLTKTSDKSKYVEIIRGKHVIVKRDKPGPMHLDGEPRLAGTQSRNKCYSFIVKNIGGEILQKTVETQYFASQTLHTENS